MKKKVWITIASVFGAILLGIGGYGLYLYNSVTSTIKDMHEPIDRDTRRVSEVNLNEKEPLSFLLLGIDAESSDRGRTDTIVVLTVNPRTKSMKMVNIPRDTRTEIIGRGFDDKINHAYAFGGAKMSIETVENFLDIPIDHFVSVNMEGFKDIVDAVGGVTVNNKFSFKQGPFTFDEGPVQLNGDAALAFVRMRKQDNRGDFGRNDRQRQVIDAIIKEGAQFSSITRAQDILQALGTNVKTDLTLDQMVKIQSNYKEARHSSETLEISGSGQTIDKIWYFIVPEEERLRISNELKEHLEIQ
ncbi:MAG: LCP family protein [Bacillaceae bacterium]|nr:LCP family protein [Bacillaceae bacterium]